MQLDELKLSLSVFTGKPIVWRENTASLSLGDGADLYVEYCADKDEVYLFSKVAVMPREKLSEFAVSLLEANMFGKDTGGEAVLAYDGADHSVALWDRMHLNLMNAKDFLVRFSSFYLAKVHWTNRLRNGRHDSGRHERRHSHSA